MKYLNPRLPAEWETQTALLLSWPHAHGLWAEILPDTVQVFVQIASITSHYQQVIINCYDALLQQQVEQLLANTDAWPANIHYFTVPSNDSWSRDYGPISVETDGKMQLVKFRFNAWGGKYNYAFDNEVVNQLTAMHAFGDKKLQHSDWVLEGGSLETDGQGTLLTTESCLLNPNRNPSLSQAQIEARLSADLGIKRVLWLKNSILTGDDTDGHIDMLVRFCNPHTLCYSTPHPGSVDAASLEAMADELRLLRTAHGKPYHLVPLPPIQPKFSKQGEQLPASYANFLIINGAVIVPIYGDANDHAALACIQECFPDRKVVGVHSMALIHQHGSVHCSTMNIF